MSATVVEFEKWEGLGNDFVLVEAEPIAWSNELVRSVCDRRRGVGADGVLFIDRGGLFDEVLSSRSERLWDAPPTTRRSAFPEPLSSREEAPASVRRRSNLPEPLGARDERSWDVPPPTSRSWDVPPPTSRRPGFGEGPPSRGGAMRAPRPPRMVVRNADGSRPEMCGNGLRCVAAYLTSHGAEASAGGALLISTDAGPRRCEVAWEMGCHQVTVEMGPARLRGTIVVEVDGRAHTFTCADVGNPHAITFSQYDEAAIDRIGPIVATFPPGGTNVEFCRLVRGPSSRVEAIDVVVWERGVGRTLACGTGACAVASAACAAGHRAYGAPLRVRLPGGELTVVVDPGSHAATMRGPARRVYTGTLEIP